MYSVNTEQNKKHSVSSISENKPYVDKLEKYTNLNYKVFKHKYIPKVH